MALATMWGCQPLPEVEYETEHLRLATDFDAPVCRGTLNALDRAASRIRGGLAPTHNDDPYLVYWLEHSLTDQCDDDTSGCFYPSTRIVFAQAQSIAHELVHATVDSPGRGFFIEEGMAELYSGRSISYDPKRLRGQLGRQLALSRRDYEHGQLSYPQAAHFAHWVYQSEGVSALQLLASVLDNAGDEDTMEDRLETIFDASLGAIEHRYALQAPRRFGGLYDDTLETLDLGDAAQWIDVVLDCSDGRVFGPLSDAEPGMMRLIRVNVSKRRTLRFRLDGDANTAVEFFDPLQSNERASPPWAKRMNTGSRLARLVPGDTTTITVDRGSYLLALMTMDTSPRRLELQILR